MSNDLISRSELMEGRVENDPVRIAAMCASPAYDVDAVCEELERLKNADIDMSDEEPELMDAEEIYDEGRAQGRVEAYVKAIEIVRSGGQEVKKIHGTLSLYFEVKDSEVFGGPGEVGYTETKINFNSEDLEWLDLQKYAQTQIETVANLCKVPQDKVRIISRTEYEENMEDEED